MKPKSAQPSKYKVGQVVSLDRLRFYQAQKRRGEIFQQIVSITRWPGNTLGDWRLRFKNGDACHEKWVRPLTKREAGRG